MEDFETLLTGAAKAHGHLCPGQVVGVRMAMLGCNLIGLDDPRTLPQIKKLIVYVEIDRCATDAIAFVTGVKLGRRSLKFVDNGIMAATFVNIETQKAFRVISTEQSRDLAAVYAPDVKDKEKQQLEAYKKMKIDDLFIVEEVLVDVPDCDLPGPTRYKAVCAKCNTVVRDKREVLKNDEILCRNCAFGFYFQSVTEKKGTTGRKNNTFAF